MCTDLCLTKYITYIHIYKTGLYQIVNDGFTQNDSIKRDIINKTKILTKLGSDTIHDIIPQKYDKYHSTTILKHVNVLAKVNRAP